MDDLDLAERVGIESEGGISDLLEKCPDCGGKTSAVQDVRGQWRCGCWATGCEGNRTWPNATQEQAESEWNRLCVQRANNALCLKTVDTRPAL